MGKKRRDYYLTEEQYQKLGELSTMAGLGMRGHSIVLGHLIEAAWRDAVNAGTIAEAWGAIEGVSIPHTPIEK